MARNSDKSQRTVLLVKCHHLGYSSDYIPFNLDWAGRSMLNSLTSLAPLHGLSLTLSPFLFSFPFFSLSLSPHWVLSLNNLATFFMTWRLASLESTEGKAARPLQSEDWNSADSVLHIPIITRPAQIQREWLKWTSPPDEGTGCVYREKGNWWEPFLETLYHNRIKGRKSTFQVCKGKTQDFSCREAIGWSLFYGWSFHTHRRKYSIFSRRQKFFHSAMDFLAKVSGLKERKKKKTQQLMYLKFHFDVQTQFTLRSKSSLDMKVSH